MTPPSRPTRRRLLAATGAGVGAGLAGCTASGGPSGYDLDQGDLEFEPLPYDETYPDDDSITMFRGGLRRLGYYPEETVPESVSINWRSPVNYAGHNAAKASPLLTPDGETVVVPADTGLIHAFGPKGRHRWVAETPSTRQGFHATPVIADGVAYLGGYDGAVRGQEAAMYAIDVGDGEVLWRTEEMDGSVAIGSSAGYWEGYIYAIVEYRHPTEKGALWVFDAASGEPVFSDDRIKGMPHPTVAIDPDAERLLSGSNDGTLYCWEFPSLEFLWGFETGGEVKGPIATYDGAAFFGSWDGNVYRVALEDGTEEWSFGTGDVVMSAPGIDPESGTVYIGSDDWHVYAIDAGTGEEVWTTDVGGRVMGAVSVTNDAVLAGTTAGELCALERDAGELRWWVETAGQVTSEPVPRDGRIYVAERGVVPGYFQDDAEEVVETPGHVYCLVGD